MTVIRCNGGMAGCTPREASNWESARSERTMSGALHEKMEVVRTARLGLIIPREALSLTLLVGFWIDQSTFGLRVAPDPMMTPGEMENRVTRHCIDPFDERC